MKNKKIYKAIACVSVWLAVVLACVGLSCFKSSKVKAGVIIDTLPVLYSSEYLTTTNYTTGLYFKTKSNILQSGTTTVFNVYINNTSSGVFDQRGTISIFGINQEFTGITLNYYAYSSSAGGTGGNLTASGNRYYKIFDDFIYISMDNIFTDILALGNNQSLLGNYTIQLRANGTADAYYKLSSTIAPVDNIYDLQQGDVAIIYISDVSGFDSSSYQPEITINWGYIDSTDNTVYAVYAPTVNVMKAPGDLEIWLNIPTDAGGSVYDSVILNQQALLTTITTGGATANANIYALYVWLLSDRIQWGLLNFNTSGLPASAMSMNYFTSYTTKYDYINSNTGSMTCRLSISDNFNFITIKNQPVFSVNTINTTLRQGGLLPAWALYNWARGSAAGYTSGTQAGAAPYQPGNSGYNDIYQAGYNAGLAAQPAAAWYEAAFTAVDDFLSIHIFPNITFGELFGIPFVISVVWFIIRMFRGGGSSG